MLFLLCLCFLIIEKSIAVCPKESFEWQDSCFLFETNATGFANAESNCVLIKGHLASIHDGFINALIAQKAEIYFHESSVTDFWIGLTNLIVPNNWTWNDASVIDFREWDSNEPQNISDANCATVSVSDGKWKSDSCYKEKPFVCKIGKILLEEATTPYPVFERCPYPYIYFEPTHSCYGDGSGKGQMNWTEGEKYCLSVGGHLASIHSDEERLFLIGLVHVAFNDIWSGAFSNDGGITWKWSDNSPWGFNPWNAGYPSLNISACGQIGTGIIFDSSCNNLHRIICKISL